MPNRVKEPHAKDPRKLASGRWQVRLPFMILTLPSDGRPVPPWPPSAKRKMGSGAGESVPGGSEPQAPDQTVAQFISYWLGIKISPQKHIVDTSNGQYILFEGWDQAADKSHNHGHPIV